MRAFQLVLVCLWLVACGKCSGESAAKPVPFPSGKAEAPEPDEPPTPNVVIISIDTLRADHMSLYGYARETTRQIDRLARSGVVFEQAFAAHTNTAPAHASMLTGVYPGVHGVRQNGMKLSSTIPTLAEMLAKHGYETGAFVSGWTLTPHTGLDRGFGVYEADFTRSRRTGLETWKIANRWIKKRAADKKPFFFFFHMFEPHFAYEPPDEYALRFLPEQTALTVPLDLQLPGLKAKKKPNAQTITEYTARYDGEIAQADAIVGKILRALKKLELMDNTLIVITSDHGETLFERPWILDHGGRAYDEQARIPLMVRFPHAELKRKRTQAQVHHVDILPTVLDVVGIDAPTDLPGRSLREVMRKKKWRTDTTRPVFTHARPEPDRVPEISAPLVKTGIVTAVRVPPFKLIEYPLANGQYFQQLFQLETDPGETKNVASQFPADAQRLHALLDGFRQTTGTAEANAPVPTLAPEVSEQLKSLGYTQ